MSPILKEDQIETREVRVTQSQELLDVIRGTWQTDFAKKVAGTYLTQVGRILCGLVTAVLVARMLGPEGRGLLAVALVIGAFGVQFANLGLHTANTYFVSLRPKSLATLLGNSFAVSFGGGLLVVAGLFTINWIRPDWIGLSGALATLAFLWVPFGLLYTLMQSLLLGVQDVRRFNIIELTQRSLALAGIAVLFLAGKQSALSIFAVTLVVLILTCVWIYRVLSERAGSAIKIDLSLLRENLGYGIKAYLAALFCFIVLRSDLLLIYHFLGAEQSGYYSAAASMADYVSIVAVVTGSILFPKLSASTDIEAKLEMTGKAVAGTAVILLPMVILAAIAAKPVISLLFGTKFLPAAYAFAWLMPGMFFLGLNSVAVQFLNSVGYPKAVVFIWGAASILNIGLNLWVITRFGIAGAAIVSSACYFLASLGVAGVIVHWRKRHQALSS